jgi:hypothetical protein
MKKVYAVRTTDYYGEYYEPVLVTNREYRPKGPDVLKVKTGKQICVQWPDTKVTTETLVIQRGTGSAQVDMNNHPDSFPTQTLGVNREVHGISVFVPLNGLKIWLPKG